MKLDFYTRRHKLREKGIRTLPRPCISFGWDGEEGSRDRQRVACFDSLDQLKCYARNVRRAGRGESLWSHFGWYSDNDGIGDLFVPLLCQWGHCLFPGYISPGGTVTVRLDPHKLEDGGGDYEDVQRQVARSADRTAERLAESEREYQEKWRRGRDLEEEAETLRESCAFNRRQIRGIVQDLRDNPDISESLSNRLRGEIKTYRSASSLHAARIRELIAEIATLPE